MIPNELVLLGNHIWQSTLFAGAAGLLTLALTKNRADVRHRIWFAASVKFLIPFSILIDAGSHFARRGGPAIAPVSLSLAIEHVRLPLVAPISLESVPAAQTWPANWMLVMICAIWSIGFVTLIYSWCLKWRRVRLALRTALPLSLPGNIQALTSRAFREPGVFGIVRPVLLLPEGINNRLTPLQLDAIVAHEICHVRRRDNLTASIHMTVEALFWFYPLVWWLGARLLEERERACDEEVLRMCTEPREYAEGILKVCQLYLDSPLHCIAGVTGGNLKRRIETIMLNRVGVELNFAKRTVVTVAAIAAFGVPVIVGFLNAPPLHAQSPATGLSGAARPQFEEIFVRRSPICRDTGGIPPPPPPGPLNGGGAADRPIPISDTGAGNDPVPGRLNQCSALEEFIRTAYVQLANGQPSDREWYGNAVPIIGGPAWIRADMYHIAAKANGTASASMMRGPMMQTLLESQFKLKVHRETRELPAYELTVAKGGPKLRPFSEGSCVPMTVTMTRLGLGQKECVTNIRNNKANVTFDRESMTLDDLSTFLFVTTDRPVANKTGIRGKFNIHLEYTPDQTTPGGVQMLAVSSRTGNNPGGQAAGSTNGLSIFTAVEEQLGLTLQSAKGFRDYLVIDSIERPPVN